MRTVAGETNLRPVVPVVLEGSPPGLHPIVEMAAEQIESGCIKIPFRNGYEHFELAFDGAENGAAVFCWTMRTFLAE